MDEGTGVFVMSGGSMRLAIDGDAEARLMYGEDMAGCVPFDGRVAPGSIVAERIGS